MKDATKPESTSERDRWNTVRDNPQRTKGHYESYYVRANHPQRALAFWIRHTIFRPADTGKPAQGELWAVWFDGETEEIVAAMEQMPLSRCAFSSQRLGAQIGHSILNDEVLYGTARQRSSELSWELSLRGGDAPLLLLPSHLYERALPRAKSVVPRPNVTLSGNLLINGSRRVDIDNWIGSQNHNWGTRHTDRYAFGQVCGFDDAPDTFLECASVKLKLGPFWTPPMTSAVIRVEGREYSATGLRRALDSRSSLSYFDWKFDTRGNGFSLSVHMTAPRYRFAGLSYRNPPGGEKTCLNSKLARCHATLRRSGLPDRELHCEQRAAFEILTDDDHHRVPILT